MALRIIYTLFLGVFLAIFIGVGIAAWYPEPTYPDMPALLKYCSQDIAQSSQKFAAYQKQAEQFDRQEKAYMREEQLYSRNVSVISLIGAVVIVIASLTLFKTIKILADGLLLGGVLTLLYSMVRGFGTNDNMFRFLVIAVGLAVTLFLGYIKFIKQQKILA